MLQRQVGLPDAGMDAHEREVRRVGPHVGVAIPCFNAERWLSRAIASVLAQGWDDTTVVVVDDGSTDGSRAVAEEFGDAVRLVESDHRGACHARNLGMATAAASGATHVLFLDADDYLEGDMLAGAAEVARERDADIVLSNMHLEFQDGSRERRFFYEDRVAPVDFFEGWMRMRYVNPSGILWRIGFVERLGGWDESLARGQDLDITLRAMLLNPVVWKNERGAAIHAQVNRGSVGRDVSRRATESRLRVQERLLAEIGGRGLAVNLFLAAFNLIPFGGIDGKTVLGWSKVVWAVSFLPTAAAAVFVVFVLGIGFT